MWLVSITQVRSWESALFSWSLCGPFMSTFSLSIHIFICFLFFSLEEKEEKKNYKTLKHLAVSILRWYFFFSHAFFPASLLWHLSVAIDRPGGCWTADFVCMAEHGRYSFVTWQFIIFGWYSTLTCHKLIFLLIVLQVLLSKICRGWKGSQEINLTDKAGTLQ